MAFFSKLKERLFKSSSKLEQGLDAIVEEGAESGAAEALAKAPAVTPEQPAPAPVPQPEAVADPEPAPEPETAPAPQPLAAPEPAPAPQTAPEPEKKSPGLLGRLMGRTAAAEPRRALDDDMLEQLEELLIAADMGVDTALRVTANLAEGRMGKKVSSREIKELLAQEVARIMEPVAKPLPIYAKRPQVVLVVGVNGSGKTTTIGKLASQFKGAGKKVVIAAVAGLGRPGRGAGADSTRRLRPGLAGVRCHDQGAGRGRRSLDDRHRGPSAEPCGSDGRAVENRSRDPQEG